MAKKKTEHDEGFDAGVTGDQNPPGDQAHHEHHRDGTLPTPEGGTQPARPPHPDPSVDPQPSQRPASAPAVVGAGDLGLTVEKLRHLAADLSRGDLAHAWDDLWAIMEQVREAWKGMQPQPVFGAAGGDPKPAADPKLKELASKLEECCQHAEGGTGHPAARAAASDAGSWLAIVLPVLMDVLMELLRKRRQPE